MHHPTALILAATVALAAIGCNRDHSGEAGSCMRPELDTCLEYTEARGGLGKKLCSDATWSAGMGKCPTENLLGVCVREEGSQRNYLYTGEKLAFTPESAKENCEGTNGTWEAK